MTAQLATAEAARGKELTLLAARAAPERYIGLSRLLSGKTFKRMLFLVGDLVAIFLAHGLAAAIAQSYFHVPSPHMNPVGYQGFYIPFFAAILYLFEGYASPDLRRPEKELAIIFKAVSFSFVALVCANFIFYKSLGFSRYLMVFWYGLALVFLLAVRFALRAFYAALWRRGLAQQKAMLIGSTEGLDEYQKNLAIQRHRGYRMLGVVTEEGGEAEESSELPILGPIERWEEIAAELDVHLVVVSQRTPSSDSRHLAPEVVQRCLQRGFEVEVYSDLFTSTALNYELDEFSGLLRFYAAPRWSLRLQRWLKAALDLVMGLVGSAVTLLLLPVVGLLIKLEDNGRIFYRREFVGCDGQIHYYLKFRTMRSDADQILRDNPGLKAQFEEKYKLKDDPRVLRTGRFLRKYSIDEFPQFVSVLTGKLTLVGPRVISSEEKKRYGDLLPKLLSVKPGITGFWQAMGRQTTSYAERVQMDMFYIDHWSIWLDLLIVAKTFWKLIQAEGAY